MFFPKQHVLHRSGRSYRLASLAALGGFILAACSSSDGSPNGSTGGAGAATTAGTTSTAGAAGTGGASVAGSAGSVTTAGAGQAGAATGGGGGSAAGTGGASGGGSGGMSSGAGGGGTGGAGGMSNEPFALKSTAFKEGDEIPLKYKCDKVNPVGQNISPPLSWGPGPAGTKSYAIVLMHLPSPEHWVIWDIPASVLSLPENVEHKAQPAVPAGSKQSLANLDGFQGSGYLGPCPQAVNSRQDYKFTLYALDVDTVPGLTATSNPTEAATAVKAHLVAGSQGVSLIGNQIRMN
jgi:Raf kinase inhibitor-like YbhB/YbcL family protein